MDSTFPPSKLLTVLWHMKLYFPGLVPCSLRVQLGVMVSMGLTSGPHHFTIEVKLCKNATAGPYTLVGGPLHHFKCWSGPVNIFHSCSDTEFGEDHGKTWRDATRAGKLGFTYTKVISHATWRGFLVFWICNFILLYQYNITSDLWLFILFYLI